MNRKKLIIYLISSIMLVAIILFYANRDYIGICPPYDVDGGGCFDNLTSVLVPVLFALLIAISVLIVKLIVQSSVFTAWKKFAVVYLPVAALLIALSPRSCGFMCFDREMTTTWMGAMYVIISLIIIIVKSIKLRKQKTETIQKKP